MIRKRTILSLALLATTAACGGGGGGSPSASGPAPAAAASGGSPSANMPSTNFSTPSAVLGADGTTTMSADQTSQTWTQTGDGSAGNPNTLNVHINSGGVAYDGTYNLSNASDPVNPFFGNSTFFQANGADGSNVVFDVSLSHSSYGLWTGPNGEQAVFAYAVDPTPADALPKSGTATYNGGAIGAGQTAGAAFNFAGASNWSVNFGSGAANGTITGTVQDVASGNQAAFGLSLSGTESGGKISATGSSTSATSSIIPTAQSAQATGILAGTGTNGAAPPELVGVATFQGGKTTGGIAFGGH